jgi:hypothetical protein
MFNLTLTLSRTLASFGLDGQIPSSIEELEQLEWLDLSNNSFSGEIPTAIALRFLTYLNLENNLLSGSIPQTLGFISLLRELHLGYNKLSGQIPETLGYLPSINLIDLSNNRLNNSIPSSLGDLSVLTSLSLESNELSGAIPMTLGDVSSLAYLSLQSNHLSGQIPLSFTKLVLLEELYLADNALLTGLIPYLPSLMILDINGTNLDNDVSSIAEIIPTDMADGSLISGDIGDAKSKDVFIIVVALLVTAAIASIGSIIYFTKGRARNRRRESKKHSINAEELSRLGSTQIGSTNQESGELVFISQISSGAFGDVWKGIYKGKTAAIKKMKLERMPKDQLKFMQSVLNEAKIMREMLHDRVVQFIAFDFRSVSIVMELMPSGALSSFIEDNKKNMKWTTRYQMMIDICEGMAFLHSPTFADGSEKQVLFHQDLKSVNVLLTEVEGIVRAKIGDFGLSRMLTL